ncbi:MULTISPECIES: hypothetical protein [Methylobacterium]|uniref:hypothetical protein n=1 Tax=Methylobacterium TaxID=407 RepID=UPI001042DD59|nr:MULTISPECIES: hypothetical protein [Methylobacterium]MDR7039437.1 Flp pilus assembly protein TadG [Methylobacterium sp. BE186]
MGARRTGWRAGLASREGGLAVEFALLASIILLVFGGLIDLVSLVAKTREMERSSTHVAAILTSCPRQGSDGCLNRTMQDYRDRKANALLGLPASATVGIAQISRVRGALNVCSGPMTYLETEVAARALSVLADGDTAIVVVIQSDHRTLLPGIARLFMSRTDRTLRRWTISVYDSQAVSCGVS